MEAAITGLTMAAQGALGANAARSGNNAVVDSMNSANAATAAQVAQLRARTAQARTDLFRKGRSIQGQIINNAAASGMSIDGSVLTLASQAAADVVRADRSILTNDNAYTQAAYGELEATKRRLSANFRSPGMAAIQGAMGGLSQGLSIAGGIKSLMPTGATNTIAGATPEAQVAFFSEGLPL